MTLVHIHTHTHYTCDTSPHTHTHYTCDTSPHTHTTHVTLVHTHTHTHYTCDTSPHTHTTHVTLVHIHTHTHMCTLPVTHCKCDSSYYSGLKRAPSTWQYCSFLHSIVFPIQNLPFEGSQPKHRQTITTRLHIRPTHTPVYSNVLPCAGPLQSCPPLLMPLVVYHLSIHKITFQSLSLFFVPSQSTLNDHSVHQYLSIPV